MKAVFGSSGGMPSISLCFDVSGSFFGVSEIFADTASLSGAVTVTWLEFSSVWCFRTIDAYSGALGECSCGCCCCSSDELCRGSKASDHFTV